MQTLRLVLLLIPSALSSYFRLKDKIQMPVSVLTFYCLVSMYGMSYILVLLNSVFLLVLG